MTGRPTQHLLSASDTFSGVFGDFHMWSMKLSQCIYLNLCRTSGKCLKIMIIVFWQNVSHAVHMHLQHHKQISGFGNMWFGDLHRETVIGDEDKMIGQVCRKEFTGSPGIG